VTDEANNVGINVGAEECHGATGTETASRDFTGRDPGLVVEGDGGKAEGGCDVGRADVCPRTIYKDGI